MKSPVQGADVNVYGVLASENLTSPLQTGTPTTDSEGRFVALLPDGTYPSESDYFRVITTGGSYVDESDPAEFPANSQRSVDLAGQFIDFLVPASPAYIDCDGDCSVTAILTPYTAALTFAADERSNASAQQCQNYQLHQAENKRFVDNSGLPFDPVQTTPANPINPTGFGVFENEKQYALLLGGFANAANVAAIQLGLPQTTVAVLEDMIDDLADGILDGRKLACDTTCNTFQIQRDYGQGVQNLPAIDLNAEIRRFRNNHADKYSSVSLPQLSAGLAAAVLPPVAGNAYFDAGSGTPGAGNSILVSAANGLKTRSCNPERADVMGSETNVVLLSESIPNASLSTDCADGLGGGGDSGFEVYADGSFCFSSHCPNPLGCDGSFSYKLVDSSNGTESYDATVYVGIPSSSVGACTPVPANLVAWYSGDNHADDIESTHHGALMNGATFSAGKVAQAFSLDGTNDFVQVQDSPDWAFGSSDFTIDLWVKFDVVNGINALVANDEGSGVVNKWIFWVSGGQLQFHVNGGGASPGRSYGGYTFNPVANTWYHLAVTRSANTYTLYVNGVPGSPDSDVVAIPDVNAPLTIGQAENNYFVDGLIDEVEIIHRALTAGEIQAIYNAGSAGKCKPTCDLTTDHTDLWEHTNHFSTTSSGALAGSDILDMFGEENSTVDAPGKFIFTDSESAGFTHSAEWVTDGPVTVSNFRLTAHHSPQAPDYLRAFKEFRLYACNGNLCDYQLLYSSPIVVPYDIPTPGPNDFFLARCANVPTTTADHFKAVFVQNGNQGPRIVELDGFGSMTFVDTDGDGLSDAQEAALGTNPNLADTDGDGISDFVEVTVDGDADDYNPNEGDSNPNSASATLPFSASFETGEPFIAEWGTQGGFDSNTTWHLHASGADVTNTLIPNYVVLATGDTSNGQVPDPVLGSSAYWYGSPVTGNYVGTQAGGDTPGSGGTSATFHSGRLISPSLDLRAITGDVRVSFKTWWEIESISPAVFDSMRVDYSVDGGRTWSMGATLNPVSASLASAQPAVPFTNTGHDSPPQWLLERSITLPGVAGAANVRVSFQFGTGDANYNGFRGWLLDGILVEEGTGTFNDDSDSDALTDRQEELFGTNPNDADSDNDGLNDAAEVSAYATDPNDDDTDGDGSSDGYEVLTLFSDPLDPTSPVSIFSSDPVLQGLNDITTDGVNGFFMTGFDSAGGGIPQEIFKIGMAGGAATIFSSAHNPNSITNDGTYIYWIDPNADSGTATAIFRMPLIGGPVDQIYSGASEGQSIVDGAGIEYVAPGKLVTSDYFDGHIHRMDATNPVTNITLLTSLFSGGFPNEHYVTVTESGGVIYVADSGKAGVSSPSVISIPLAGGSPTTLYSGSLPSFSPRGIAMNGSTLYLTNGTEILQMPITGGTPTVFVQYPSFESLNGLTYFSDALYVTDAGLGTQARVWRVDLSTQ